MDSELITPSVTTGFKLAGTAASAMFVRANQALNNVSDDNIRKVFNDSAIELKTKYLNVMGSCIGQYSMTNVSEKDIVKKLMCKIIANKNENKPYLDDKILETLSSIITVYSNNKYISMSKQIYENEKKAASDAIVNGILGTQFVNTGVDIGVATVKSALPKSSFVEDYLTPPPPPAHTSPLDAAKSSLEKAVFPAFAAIASFYVGKTIFKKLNKIISKQYIPDFNLLVTAIIERQ